MKRLIPVLAAALSLAAGVAMAAEQDLTYFPDGDAFVCVNGSNLYSRALYGSNESEWRLETSDRPIFASYKKNNCRNIRFLITIGGKDYALDSAEYCEARYTGGRRDYVLRDRRWGKGRVCLSVVAYYDREGASFRFSADSITGASLKCIVSHVRGQKFRRFGDLGTVDNPSVSFGPLPGSAPVCAAATALPSSCRPTYFSVTGDTLSSGADAMTARLFTAADEYRARLAGSVVFDTPDKFINPIGGAMVMAADGAWNGQVWLHGAVGWRMPLPGWRAAYMGDFLGMPDRQRSHFDAYAKSQVTDVPVTLPHLMDSSNNLARGAYRWGTPMYSNGYICRNPGNNHQFHHYDMNLNYIDELLWHCQFDADTAYLRHMWPVLRSHLAWEKETWDPDGDGLYDAYCCIWASDALQYSSGAVTHSSAYNYRGNMLAARIAELIGEDPAPYRREAERILKAMNHRLWLDDEGHWAEYQDFLGLKRLHKDAALWSVYTPIDCGACTPEQAYRATRYVDSRIPHIPFTADGESYATIATSDWQPYEWSINNVAMAEVSHTALAYFKAGRQEAAFRLLKSNLLDFMYMGSSPGNFGQISKYDAHLGEAYRDFADVTGITSRAVIEGLFGITPEALYGRCVIRPGFPSSWDSVHVRTPYLEYTYRRAGGKDHFTIRQHFARPLQIVIRQNTGNGGYKDNVFTADTVQSIILDTVGYREEPPAGYMMTETAHGTALDDVRTADCKPVDMSGYFNSSVTDIFRNKYMSPRSPYTTLALPTQGIGDWCSTKKTADIDDGWLRRQAAHGPLVIGGIPFVSPAQGQNIAFTSLWDNYPDSITIPLKGRGSRLYLLMTGSTNPMQSHTENACVRVEYRDGSCEELSLRNPSNWCPIEQDYDDGTPAFMVPKPRPLRVSLKSGASGRALAVAMGVRRAESISDSPSSKVAPLAIDGGAAEVLEVRLNPKKKLRSITLRTTANDVVAGLMAVTVQN